MSTHPEGRINEMLEIFFQSAQELLQTLNEQGLVLERDAHNAEAVREIQRVVHTLKGDSAACGFRELSELAHELEDVLAPPIADANAAALAEVVLSAADMFDAMCAAYRAGLEPPNGDPLRAMIWRMAQKTAPPTSAKQVAQKFSWTEYDQAVMREAAGRGLRVYQIAAVIELVCPMRIAGLALLKKVVQESGNLLASAPEQALWEHATQVEFAIASALDEKALAARCRIPGVVANLKVEEFAPAPEASQELGSTESGAAAGPPERASEAGARDTAVNRTKASAENTLRVDADRVDNLLNLVGELVVGKSMLHQVLHDFTQRSPNDPLRTRFADALAFQSQVLNSLQRSAMKIRMVPVDQLFRRFPRVTRDVAKLCSKQVTLEMSGQETDLDKRLLDALAEPLMHLLRNAIDHGIEAAAERRAAGKPEHGRVRLHACHQGNQVVIEMSDDGRGIDPAAVLAKAVSRGLVKTDKAAAMTEAEAVDLIFSPGFSTADQVTEISGRGIGMDVVKAAVQKLKGTINIETLAGRGTRFQLRLPLTLAIMRTMLFRAGERLYAIPLDSVVEITRASQAEIHRVDDHEALQLRNDVLTLVRLNRLAPSQSNKSADHMFVVVLGGERKFGLVVDKLVGEQELVIKPLDETIIASELVSGASILGDGTVVLILNVAEVVRKFARTSKVAPGSAPARGGAASMEASA